MIVVLKVQEINSESLLISHR